jgi:hypothetical protein
VVGGHDGRGAGCRRGAGRREGETGIVDVAYAGGAGGVNGIAVGGYAGGVGDGRVGD